MNTSKNILLTKFLVIALKEKEEEEGNPEYWEIFTFFNGRTFGKTKPCRWVV